MAEKEFFIYMEGTLVEVSREVYEAYYRSANHSEYLDKMERHKGKVLFSDLDSEGIIGEEMIPDQSVNIEERAIMSILADKLRYCITLLSEEDQALIHALYFLGFTEREYAEKMGLSQSAIHKRKQRTIKKLQKYFKK